MPMLPLLEQGAALQRHQLRHEQWTATNPAQIGYAPNTTVSRSKINALLCPSDLDRMIAILEGHDNYTFCGGSSPNSVNTLTAFSGMFLGADPNAVLNTRVFGFRDVLDGLSQTVAMGERIKGNATGYNMAAGLPDGLRPTSDVYNLTTMPVTSPGPAYAACKAVNPATATACQDR